MGCRGNMIGARLHVGYSKQVISNQSLLPCCLCMPCPAKPFFIVTPLSIAVWSSASSLRFGNSCGFGVWWNISIISGCEYHCLMSRWVGPWIHRATPSCEGCWIDTSSSPSYPWSPFLGLSRACRAWTRFPSYRLLLFTLGEFLGFLLWGKVCDICSCRSVAEMRM